ncbi:hypothetical protein FHS51_004181 [Sphingobium wenxiniae]|uniref:Uncharacterized protein n=1 Tax=Sphingobium wenxiniae (strain DSM 21828 / CGMCC 1.7748 / JZ-1) TaxID=595605 RepID=A0A562JVK5_SPHWJ|nr:hypothetical protein [Sphingobium wenxiniae]MBB6193922.1 hypothetical protein [Sphingobium wenxiniae]TWH87176.1 hypothetical protein IQ35_04008 [Sphingobium wenxiniae]
MQNVEHDAYRAVANAWIAVQSGFEIRTTHKRDEGPWGEVDVENDQIHVMGVATRAYNALRELQDTLFDRDVAELVLAACGSGPFTYLKVIEA